MKRRKRTDCLGGAKVKQEKESGFAGGFDWWFREVPCCLSTQPNPFGT